MSINFVRTPSKNYALVQEQILGLIKRQLEPGSWTETESARRDGALNFTLFIHQPADVVMSHGVADKNYFLRKDESGERIANRLSYIFVPGEWLKHRLVTNRKLSLSPEQVHVVGWPRLDTLLSQQSVIASRLEPGRRKRVLWAPTHDYARRGEENLSLSSYPEFEQYLPLLEKHFDVEVSLHPRNRKDKMPTAEKLLWADYVVSDFGTMVYEAWALGKPVLFPSWIIRDRILKYMMAGCAEWHIFNEKIGIHPSSFDEMLEVLLAGCTLDRKVQDFLQEYLEPQYLGCSAKRVATLLEELSR